MAKQYRTVARWGVKDILGQVNHSGISLSGSQRLALPVVESFLEDVVQPYIDGEISRVSIEDVVFDESGLYGGISGAQVSSYVAAIHLKSKVSEMGLLIPLCSVNPSNLTVDGKAVRVAVEGIIKQRAEMVFGEEFHSSSWCYMRGHKTYNIRK